MTAITSVLSYLSSAHRIDLRVGDTAVARIDHLRGQTHTSLVMLGGRRTIDVSPQPRTVPTLLRREARRRREDPNRWCGGVSRLLFDHVRSWGIEALPADDRDDLDALLASITFPLGLLARLDGAGPLPFVPRWAMPALLASTPTAAVRQMFGTKATRGTARALAQGMRPTAPAPAAAAPDLRPLGLAWSLRDTLRADRLTNVLAGANRWQPPQHWPRDDDIDDLHRLWPLIDASTAVALALDSLTCEHGIVRLRRALRLIESLAAVSGLAVARTVAGLERQATTAAPLRAPDPIPRPPIPVAPLRPPGGPRPRLAVDRFAYPPAVEIADGYQLGEHRLILPRNATELARWGRRLSNCLADYAPAVAAGRSVVIGVEEQGTLVAALELTGNRGTVRQFVASANARPSAARRDAVDEMLHNLGLGDR
jgi:PcfJ-like protein